MLRKEVRLTAHPMTFLLVFGGAMVLIPNYPYTVAFFYVTLGLFFRFVNARDQRDFTFCMLLPLRRRDVVRGAFAFSVAVEAAAVLVAGAAVWLGAALAPGRTNGAGVDANAAAIGFGLVVLAVFNGTFFPAYYRTGYRVGAAFARACVGMALVAALDVVAPHLVPWLDGRDPRQLAVLAAGAAVYAAVTLCSCRVSAARFERADL